MGEMDGRVALITGAARGIGRSHAVRLAAEGADLVLVDLCAAPDAVASPGATREDLDATVAAVEAEGRRAVAAVADVRDSAALRSAVEEGVAALGPLAAVISNAGIWAVSNEEPTDPAGQERIWQETIDINLTGAWNTLRATVPGMLEEGRGGSIVVTASTAAMRAIPLDSVAQNAYTVSKLGLVGLMKIYAAELGPHSIRVNAVAPTGVATPMVENDAVASYMESRSELGDLMANLMPAGPIEPSDVSDAVAFLCSDRSRYVTGTVLPVDAGFLLA